MNQKQRCTKSNAVQTLTILFYVQQHTVCYCMELHKSTVFRLKPAVTDAKRINVLVHDTSQLVISAWSHSSASYELPSALTQLRHTGINKACTLKWTHTFRR